ncbi:hypothetical protein ACFU6I_08895 [Streptomyces sp. NPDC057486]|uniref:hypothetical protein n=1 Tax=Streptomyces sp. NPDC057486 TaxID=3346145 RepID=UPI0036751AB2
MSTPIWRARKSSWCAGPAADPENRASVAVARRAGFTYLKQAVEADGASFNRYVHDLRGAQPQG